MPGIGTNSLGSKFRTGTNCLGNFDRPEHLAAGPSRLIHRLLTDFVCLYNYEFLLSLCKIVRSSEILLLPLLSNNLSNLFILSL